VTTTRSWTQHYCGRRHNPRYPCPQAVPILGGVPATALSDCTCHEVNWHAEDCPRRLAIQKNMRRKR
jgi:hypothetical protein